MGRIVLVRQHSAELAASVTHHFRGVQRRKNHVNRGDFYSREQFTLILMIVLSWLVKVCRLDGR